MESTCLGHEETPLPQPTSPGAGLTLPVFSPPPGIINTTNYITCSNPVHTTQPRLGQSSNTSKLVDGLDPFLSTCKPRAFVYR